MNQRLVQRELAEVAEQTGEVDVALLIFREPKSLRRRVRELGDLAHADRNACAGQDQAREHLAGRDEAEKRDRSHSFLIHGGLCQKRASGTCT